MTIALGARPVTRHRSAAVTPGVCLPFVSIRTLMWRSWKREGSDGQAITQGSCGGAFVAVSGGVEAFEDVARGGDGQADGGV
jgi:hypothetical protein